MNNNIPKHYSFNNKPLISTFIISSFITSTLLKQSRWFQHLNADLHFAHSCLHLNNSPTVNFKLHLFIARKSLIIKALQFSSNKAFMITTLISSCVIHIPNST